MTSEDYAIPVDVTVAAGEEATLSFSDLNIPSGASFYLDDTELNTQTLLTSEQLHIYPNYRSEWNWPLLHSNHC